MEDLKLIKICCKGKCKCHSASPWYNHYVQIKIGNKKSKNLKEGKNTVHILPGRINPRC
jgi:hypothetical protein